MFPHYRDAYTPGQILCLSAARPDRRLVNATPDDAAHFLRRGFVEADGEGWYRLTEAGLTEARAEVRRQGGWVLW